VAPLGSTLACKEPVAKHTANQINLLADDSAWTAGIITNLESEASLPHLISDPDESAASAL